MAENYYCLAAITAGITYLIYSVGVAATLYICLLPTRYISVHESAPKTHTSPRIIGKQSCINKGHSHIPPKSTKWHICDEAKRMLTCISET